MRVSVKKRRVGVLMGGLSAEREVSLATGRAVAGALLTVALLHIAANPGLFRRRRPLTDAGGAA